MRLDFFVTLTFTLPLGMKYSKRDQFLTYYCSWAVFVRYGSYKAHYARAATAACCIISLLL